MILFDSFGLIIPLNFIVDNYRGGLNEFTKNFSKNKLQSDDYLISIRLNNASEIGVALDHLISLGIHFDEGKDESEECTVWTKEGLWWDVPWLIIKNDKAWFIADINAPE